MANKKIYTLTICYNDDTDTVEWLQETIDREDELPEGIIEVKSRKELKEYLRFLSSGRKPNKKGGKIKSKYSKGGGVRTAKYKVQFINDKYY